jgi:hypothetical protein
VTAVSRPRRRFADNAPVAIYGTIISASVLAAAYEDTTLEIAAGMFITLLVYWLAERWSELIGGHLRGEPLSWSYTREVFASGWPMVQASYGPLIVLLVSDWVGASAEVAVDLALAWTIVTLFVLGFFVGRRAHLGFGGQALSAFFVGALGMLLIGLKALLH